MSLEKDVDVGWTGGYKRAFGLGEKLRPRMGKRQYKGSFPLIS